jgi:hypothetical protein
LGEESHLLNFSPKLPIIRVNGSQWKLLQHKWFNPPDTLDSWFRKFDVHVQLFQSIFQQIFDSLLSIHCDVVMEAWWNLIDRIAYVKKSHCDEQVMLSFVQSFWNFLLWCTYLFVFNASSEFREFIPLTKT